MKDVVKLFTWMKRLSLLSWCLYVVKHCHAEGGHYQLANLLYSLSIAERRIVECIPFPRVLMLCEIQAVLSMFWTQIARTISCDGNHYTTSASTYICIYWALNTKRDMTQGQFLNEVQQVWIQFSFFQTSCHASVKEPKLSYYLSITGGRIVGFISFARVLALWERQIVSSRTWTGFAMSISYIDNSTNTYLYKYIYIYIYTHTHAHTHKLKNPCMMDKRSRLGHSNLSKCQNSLLIILFFKTMFILQFCY